MFTYIYSLFLNFLELSNFPQITRKRSGFSGIQEISFKAETLVKYLRDNCILTTTTYPKLNPTLSDHNFQSKHLHWILCHSFSTKSHFPCFIYKIRKFSNFEPTVYFIMLRNFGAVCQIFMKIASKLGKIQKKKVLNAQGAKLFYEIITQNVEGGGVDSTLPVLLGLNNTLYEV